MDLSTTYLGLELPHPFMPGASPLVDDLDNVRRLEDAGASAIVMRSLFEEQLVVEEISSHAYTDFHRDSHAEARSFLPDPERFVFGPDEYLAQLRRIKEAVRVPVIASLNGTTLGGWLDHARLMEQAGADALELNVYSLAADPSSSGQALEDLTLEMIRAIKKAVKIPVAVKLSPFYSSLSHFARGAQEAGVDALVLFNRFYQPDIDVEALEVKRALHLSDSSELPLRLRWLAILSGQLQIPLAASGGVHTAVDAVQAIMAGACAVQVVSALLKNGPGRLKTLREEVTAWMEEREYESLRQMRGSMNLASCPDPGAYERANYMLLLQSWRQR